MTKQITKHKKLRFLLLFFFLSIIVEIAYTADVNTQKPYVTREKSKNGVITIYAETLKLDQLPSLVQYMKADRESVFYIDRLSVSFLSAFLDYLIASNVIQRVIGVNIIIENPDYSKLNEVYFLEMMIPQIKHFTHLDLRVNGVTQKSIEAIAYHLKKLKRLHIRGEFISDQDVEAIAHGLPQLKSLSLTHTSITDAGLTPLASLINLEELEINGEFFSDSGLMTLLSRLPKIHSIGFPQHAFEAPENCLSCLKELQSLSELNLSDTAFHSLLVPSFLNLLREKHPNLHTLNLSQTVLCGQDLVAIVSALPELKELRAESPFCALSDQHFAEIGSRGKKIETLEVKVGWITDQTLLYLAQLSHLKKLSLVAITPMLGISLNGLMQFLKKSSVDTLTLSLHHTPMELQQALAEPEITQHIDVHYVG